MNFGVLELTTTAAAANVLGGSGGTINVASGGVLAVQANTTHAPNGWTNANINTLLGLSNVVFNSGSSLGLDVYTVTR